jgi:hypothetical protein
VSATETLGIDRARRSPGWKTFGAVTSLAALVRTFQQAWNGDRVWTVTQALDGLWTALALPLTSWMRDRWESGGPEAFIPVFAFVGLALVALMVLKSFRGRSYGGRH